MQTPWGDFAVCDAHVHFFSPAFFAALAAQAGISSHSGGPATPGAGAGPGRREICRKLLGMSAEETERLIAERVLFAPDGDA